MVELSDSGKKEKKNEDMYQIHLIKICNCFCQSSTNFNFKSLILPAIPEPSLFQK